MAETVPCSFFSRGQSPAAHEGEYQLESFAIDLVVRIVERYLADHRDLFRDDERRRDALIQVLDIFVEAGWPEAYRLTYQLDR